MGDAGELKVVGEEGVLAAEIWGGNGTSGIVGRFHGDCCAGKGNKESTIVGTFIAISFYHEQFVGLSMPLGNLLIRSVR